MFDKKIKKIIATALVMTLSAALMQGCGQTEGTEAAQSVQQTEEDEKEETESVKSQDAEAEAEEEDSADELNGTLKGDTVPAGSKDDTLNETEKEEDEQEEESTEPHVDLIMFMGQSNMSGCGGDASLAPKAIEGAGYEFRAISDPTKLYPITEPFGVKENNINGIMEKPNGKKGSMVTAFVNEYYKKTGTPVVAVSASVGETSLDDWLKENMQSDAVDRFRTAKEWLTGNGYVIDHMYMVWLQGESDALKKKTSDEYKSQMDDFIRPFFIEGMQKVFIVTPGRTIDETEIYTQIINAQEDMCKTSGYYALATDVLTKVSTEYMTDIYHYNQHVLNMVGKLAADSVAYYSKNNREAVMYSYKNDETFIPDGCEDYLGEAFGETDLTNINKEY